MTTLAHILSLARSGSPARAWALFVEAGFDSSEDPKALSLKGRLLKDQAKAAKRAGNIREQMCLYDLAASAYEQAANPPDSYPLINAASLALLSGKPERAAMLAARVITLIDDNPDEGENIYWRGATRAEALLLRGQETRARAALTDAIACLPHAWEDHAATIGQFTAILSEQGKDDAWLDRHRPPPSIHYSGIIAMVDENISSAIDAYLHQEKPAFVYGALAAGSDIMFAEAFLRYRDNHNPFAQLYIILPFPSDEFCQTSVAPFGERWSAAYHKILGQADGVHIMGLDNPPHDIAIALADKISMGQTVRNARNLQSRAKAFTIKGMGETLRPQLQKWQDAGHDLTVLEAPRDNRTTGALPTNKNNKAIYILLWANGLPPNNLALESEKNPEKLGEWHRHKNSYYMLISDVNDAYMIAQTLMDDAREISMIYDIMDAPSPDILGRAMSIASVAQPHIITSDYNSAMALEYEKITQSVEEMGELKSPWGAQSIWRIN